MVFRNTVVDTVLIWGRQIQNKMPFSGLTFLGSNTERAAVEIGNKRSAERASHAASGNFSGQTFVDSDGCSMAEGILRRKKRIF